MAWQETPIQKGREEFTGGMKKSINELQKSCFFRRSEGWPTKLYSGMELAGLIITEIALSVSNSPFKRRSIGMMGGIEREEEEAVHEAQLGG